MSYKVRSWIDRFFEKISFTDSCWIWEGTKDKYGYGIFKINYQYWKAHRITYLLSHGNIDSKLTIDHLCRNTFCVNPAHLELVNIKTNLLRGEGACAKNSRKKHCKHGHEFTEYNTYITKIGRQCRICLRERSRVYYYKKKALELAAE